MSDVVSYVEARIYFLAWIKDIVWVEKVFGFFEDFEHLFGKHSIEVRSADDTVVMFTTDVTFEFDCGVIKCISHFFYQHGGCFVGEIK